MIFFVISKIYYNNTNDHTQHYSTAVGTGGGGGGGGGGTSATSSPSPSMPPTDSSRYTGVVKSSTSSNPNATAYANVIVDPLASNSHQQLASASSWSSLANCGSELNQLHNLNIPVVGYMNQASTSTSSGVDLTNTANVLTSQHQLAGYSKLVGANEQQTNGLIMTSNNGVCTSANGLNPAAVSSLSSSSLSASSSSSSSLSNVNDPTQDQSTAADQSNSTSNNNTNSLKVIFCF